MLTRHACVQALAKHSPERFDRCDRFKRRTSESRTELAQVHFRAALSLQKSPCDMPMHPSHALCPCTPAMQGAHVPQTCMVPMYMRHSCCPCAITMHVPMHPRHATPCALAMQTPSPCQQAPMCLRPAHQAWCVPMRLAMQVAYAPQL